MTHRPIPYCTRKKANNLLVIRFSALGDILMTIPVIDELSRRYPELEITVASRPYVESIFSLLPSNVHFIGIEPHGKHVKQIYGLLKSLWRHDDKKASAVCDLHYVFRTISMDALFLLDGFKVRHIEKEKIATLKFLKHRPLLKRKSTFERYADVFAKLGYPIDFKSDKPYSLIPPPSQRNGIGVAPFAAHCGKIYPLENMEKLVAMLSHEEKVYLFGAGEKEKRILDEWEHKYPNVRNMAGALENMAEELRFIAGLRLMLCMDSGNMHLTSLAGTRAISIWGATHPLAGFLGWGQKPEDCIQADIPCRPCSIYGNKPCRYGNYLCLSSLDVNMVYDKIKHAL